ncbi:MAG: hypothetical protein JWM49_2868 [Microbacteriaceae bacterium]|nr:hypothetical protein [Microbacteriaceae bacterium]
MSCSHVVSCSHLVSCVALPCYVVRVSCLVSPEVSDFRRDLPPYRRDLAQIGLILRRSATKRCWQADGQARTGQHSKAPRARQEDGAGRHSKALRRCRKAEQGTKTVPAGKAGTARARTESVRRTGPAAGTDPGGRPWGTAPRGRDGVRERVAPGSPVPPART